MSGKEINTAKERVFPGIVLFMVILPAPSS